MSVAFVQRVLTADGVLQVNEFTGIETRTREFSDGSKQIVKTFSAGATSKQAFAKNIIDYDILATSLINSGIENFSLDGEFSLIELLEDSKGSINISAIKKIIRNLQLVLNKISQTQVFPEGKRFESTFLSLILEGLTQILFWQNQNGNKNIPKVMDIVIGPGHKVMLIQEFIEGQTIENLRKEISDEQILSSKISKICSGLGAILDAASAIDSTQEIHFDLNPKNILVNPVREGYLMDFGISFANSQNNSLASKTYGFDSNGDQIVGSTFSDAAEEYSQQNQGTPEYSGPSNYPNRKLSKAVTADSFSVTLTCLDLIAGLDRSARDISTFYIAINAKDRSQFLDHIRSAMESKYKELWDSVSDENSCVRAEFFDAVTKVAEVGLNESIYRTQNGIELPTPFEIKNSARLIPLLFYALFQCFEVELGTNEIRFCEQKFYIVRKCIELCTLPTIDFLEESNFTQYRALICQEPMFSATKRSLKLCS